MAEVEDAEVAEVALAVSAEAEGLSCSVEIRSTLQARGLRPKGTDRSSIGSI